MTNRRTDFHTKLEWSKVKDHLTVPYFNACVGPTAVVKEKDLDQIGADIVVHSPEALPIFIDCKHDTHIDSPYFFLEWKRLLPNGGSRPSYLFKPLENHITDWVYYLFWNTYWKDGKQHHELIRGYAMRYLPLRYFIHAKQTNYLVVENHLDPDVLGFQTPINDVYKLAPLTNIKNVTNIMHKVLPAKNVPQGIRNE